MKPILLLILVSISCFGQNRLLDDGTLIPQHGLGDKNIDRKVTIEKIVFTNSYQSITTNQLRMSYDATRFVDVGWTSKTNLLVNGVDMRRFLELVKILTRDQNLGHGTTLAVYVSPAQSLRNAAAAIELEESQRAELNAMLSKIEGAIK